MTDDIHAPESASDPRTRSTRPEPRSKGRRRALTIAIVVTALLLIGAPLLAIWTSTAEAAHTIATPRAAEVTPSKLPAHDEPVVPVVPVGFPAELPWDVELGGDASVALLSQLPEAEGWDPSGANEYTHAQTGCVVWHTNGRLGPAAGDVTGGDRAASLALIESAYGVTLDQDHVYDGEISSMDESGSEFGVADALANDFTVGDRALTVIARSFAGIGEGVTYSVECSDAALVAATIDDLSSLLSIALIPTDGARK